MLAIRMQRTGRKGFATYRIVVQDVRQTPTSGRVVAQLGSYNPHTKEIQIDKEKSKFYLDNGAQPSDRVAVLFKKQGIKLPSWVNLPAKKKSTIKNVEKLRKNRPAEPVAEKPAKEEAVDKETPAEEPAEEPVEEAVQPEAPTEEETPAEPVEEPAAIEETQKDK